MPGKARSPKIFEHKVGYRLDVLMDSKGSIYAKYLAAFGWHEVFGQNMQKNGTVCTGHQRIVVVLKIDKLGRRAIRRATRPRGLQIQAGTLDDCKTVGSICP